MFHAAFAQFCYTGAKVATAGYFINYITETRPNTDSALGAKFLAVAQGCFALGGSLDLVSFPLSFFFYKDRTKKSDASLRFSPLRLSLPFPLCPV